MVVHIVVETKIFPEGKEDRNLIAFLSEEQAKRYKEEAEALAKEKPLPFGVVYEHWLDPVALVFPKLKQEVE